MATIHLTARQAAISKALVKVGYFGNESEVGRAAFEKLIADLKPGQRREVALQLFRDGDTSVSRFAELANMTLHEARVLLREEKLLEEESADNAGELKRNIEAGAKRFR